MLEYGKALHGYHHADGGDARVYGTNGPIGHTGQALGHGPTVVVGRKGAYRGVHYAPGAFWVIDTAFWLRPLAPMNMRWAYYQLLTQDINGRDSGSAIPSLSRSDFYSFPVQEPSLPEQDAIAEVLGALDDKIDANARLVSLCEALATAHLERAEQRVPIDDLAEVVRDHSAPEQFSAVDVAHFSLPAFDAARLPERCSGQTIRSSKFVLSTPAVLVSKLNPHIPRVWYAVPSPGILSLASTEFVVLRPKSPWTPELLWAACSSRSYVAALADQVTGTTGSHQRVRPEDVLAGPVADLWTVSEEVRVAIELLVRRAAAAREESVCVVQLRDTLLPPLLSGKLRVRAAEAVLADAT